MTTQPYAVILEEDTYNRLAKAMQTSTQSKTLAKAVMWILDNQGKVEGFDKLLDQYAKLSARADEEAHQRAIEFRTRGAEIARLRRIEEAVREHIRKVTELATAPDTAKAEACRLACQKVDETLIGKVTEAFQRLKSRLDKAETELKEARRRSGPRNRPAA